MEKRSLHLRQATNSQLLNFVQQILAKPGEVTTQDVADLQEINNEFVRRDQAFFAAIQNSKQSSQLRGANGN